MKNVFKSALFLCAGVFATTAFSDCRYEWNGSEYIWVCDSDPTPDPIDPSPPAPTCEYEWHCSSNGCSYVWVCN